jgi:hypothetical protein
LGGRNRFCGNQNGSAIGQESVVLDINAVIHHMNTEMSGFWLPEQNRNEIKVRIGGTAAMTIDYGTYRIVSRQ